MEAAAAFSMAMQHRNTRPDKTYLSYKKKTHVESNNKRLARIIMVFIITQFQKGSTDFLISSGAITAKLRYATPAENKFTKF